MAYCVTHYANSPHKKRHKKPLFVLTTRLHLKLPVADFFLNNNQAAKAFKSCLMKRCFVHESMAKFVAAVQAEGNVELNIIRGDVADTDFGRYGMIVFELFYRVDLSTM